MTSVRPRSGPSSPPLITPGANPTMASDGEVFRDFVRVFSSSLTRAPIPSFSFLRLPLLILRCPPSREERVQHPAGEGAGPPPTPSRLFPLPDRVVDRDCPPSQPFSAPHKKGILRRGEARKIPFLEPVAHASRARRARARFGSTMRRRGGRRRHLPSDGTSSPRARRGRDRRPRRRTPRT